MNGCGHVDEKNEKIEAFLEEKHEFIVMTSKFAEVEIQKHVIRVSEIH